MTQSRKVLYPARIHTIDGRENGAARSAEAHLEIRLSLPRNGSASRYPEQLFAAGWSACFEGAIGLACREKKVPFPSGVAIDAEVDLCLGESGYFLQACLNLSLPGLEREVARALVDTAHGAFPYSKAIHGNVDVVITLV